jgi:hypothetical protein
MDFTTVKKPSVWSRSSPLPRMTTSGERRKIGESDSTCQRVGAAGVELSDWAGLNRRGTLQCRNFAPPDPLGLIAPC